MTNHHLSFRKAGIFCGLLLLLVHTSAGAQGNTVVAWGDNTHGQTNVPPGLTNVLGLAAGAYYSLALKNDGTVVAWGDNTDGQTNVPAGLSNVVSIAAGWFHNLALKNDGTVVAWGDNFFGETNVPGGLSNVVAVAAGAGHSLALLGNGTVVAWGDNSDGERNVPTGLSNVVAIAAGAYHCLALQNNGTIVAWGAGETNAGGGGVTGLDFGQSIVPTSLSNVVAIAAGPEHSLALQNNGTVVAWGDNTYGQTNVPSGLRNVVAVATGADAAYNLALQTNGTVVVWGSMVSVDNNYNGQTNVPPGLSNVVALAAGGHHSMALAGNGMPFIGTPPLGYAIYSGLTASFTVRAFGASPLSYQWRLNGTNLLGATNALLSLTNVQSTSSGLYNVVVTNSKGTAISSNATLTVINAAPIITSEPTNVVLPLGQNAQFYVTATASLPLSYQWQFNGTNIAGATNAFLMVSNLVASTTGPYDVVVSNPYGATISSNAFFVPVPSLVVSWGEGFFGETQVPPGLTNVLGLAGGEYFSLALLGNGTVVGWGDDSFGQTTVPVGLNNVVAIAAGWDDGLALQNNGSVAAWGYNYYGQTNVPLQLNNVVAVAAGGYHSLALQANGTVVAWGLNGSGQTNVPAGLNNVVAIAGGGYHSVALQANGTLVAWGDNTYGQTAVPVGLSNVVAIAGGGYHSLALQANGTVVAWGYNNDGQTTVPTGLSNVVAIAAGLYHSIALKSDGTLVAWGGNTNGQTTIQSGLNNVVAITAGGYHNLALVGNGSPFIETPPLSNTTYSGMNAAFIVAAFGASPLSYQWLLNGTNIAGATNSWLSFTSVQTTNSGVYSVVVTNPKGTAVSSNATLAVINAVPIITTEPGNMALPLGQNARFYVTATGSPPLSYQWQFNGTNIIGATNAFLTLSNLMGSNVGVYDVVVSNLYGTTVSSNAVFAPISSLVVSWGDNVDGETNVPPGLTAVIGLAGGEYFSLALQANGTVVAWGDNSYGQTTVPVGLSNLVAIAGGWYHSLALQNNGTVVAWGDNTYGEASVPLGLSNVVAIAAGEYYSLALEGNGTVVGWGETTVPVGLSNVVAIAAGSEENFGLALKNNGTVVAWGDNSYGETSVPTSLSNVVAIVAGGYDSLALQANGTVVAWGLNGSGQTNVPAGLNNVVAIAAGGAHCMALQANGMVVAWGYNNNGQTNVPAGLNNVVSISGGGYHSLALVGSGSSFIETPPLSNTTYSGMNAAFVVAAFGASPLRYQWLFNGTNIAGATNSWLSFSNVQTTNAGVYSVVVTNPKGTAISSNATLTVINAAPIITTEPGNAVLPLGQNAQFYVTVTGSLPLSYQWRFDGTNIIGATNAFLIVSNLVAADVGAYDVVVSNLYGTTISSNAVFVVGPVKAWGNNVYGQSTVPSGLNNVVAIAAGGYDSLALQGNGSLVEWGQDMTGQTNVPMGLNNVVAIAVGGMHSLALQGNGTVVAWGWNYYGQSAVPSGLSNVVAIAAGDVHSLALQANGTVAAWGDNTYGETNVPAGLSNVVAIAAGLFHSLALRVDGTVVAWGTNSSGQTNVPIGLNNVVAIAGGGYHSLALQANGTVVAWGYDGYGETDVPPGLSNVVAIAAGLFHSVALQANGTVTAWGYNADGETTVPAGLSNVMAVAAGFYHTLALVTNTTPPIPGATVYWVGGNGDWTNTANWSTEALPGTNDNVVISSVANITVTHSAGTHTVNSIQSSGAYFILSGGLLKVTATFQTTNSILLSGGTLQSATVVITTNEAALFIEGQSGTLDGVTVNGVLDVGDAYDGALLKVTNGLVLNGTALVGEPILSSFGSGGIGAVEFDGTQTLSGNGKVALGRTDGYLNNALYLADSNATLTLGPGIIVDGEGTIGYGIVWGGAQNTAIVNRGVILSDIGDFGGGTITINASPLVNSGTVAMTNGGSLNINYLPNPAGLVISGSGTLTLNGPWQNTGFLNAAALNLNGIWSNSGTIAATTLSLSGSWTNTGTIIVANGTLTLMINGNWSNTGTINAIDSTVNLGGAFTLANLGANLGVFITGGKINLTGTLTNTSTTLTLSTTNDWGLNGGTILGGNVMATNGVPLFVKGSGTLNGVTLDGVLDVGNTYNDVNLAVTNGLVLNGTALVGNPTNGNSGAIDFEGTQTLSGSGQVVFGNGENALYLADGSTTLTIGGGITVEGQNGMIGYGNDWGGSQNASVVNQGVISADVSGGTITVNAEPFSNLGLAQAINGGTLILNGTWNNSGTLAENGGTLNLGGSFTLANVGQLNQTNGTVNLTGTLINTNTTLNLSALPGPWQLNGGTILGGTVVATNGVPFLAQNGTFNVGTLNGVTVDGVLDIFNIYNNEYLAVTNGLVLNGTALVGNPTNGNSGAIDFEGTQTLSGSGQVVFGNGENALYLADGSTTLTIGGGITVEGQNGMIGYGNDWGGSQNASVVNQGVISADVSGGTITVNAEPFSNLGLAQAINGGTLILNGTWNNSGTLAENGGTLNLGGSFTLANVGQLNQTNGTVNLTGTLINTNTTLNLSALPGPWQLNGGTILGGTVVATNGVPFLAQNGTFNVGTLNGVTVDGVLDIFNIYNNEYLAVTNGLVLNGTALVGNPTNGNSGAIDFEGTQTLSGSGKVVFGYGVYNALYLADGGTTLTIGSEITVEGQNGTIGYGTDWGGSQNVSAVNQGIISPDISGGMIIVNPQSFTNEGTLQVFPGCTINAKAALTLDDPTAFITKSGASFQVSSNLLGNTRNADQYAPEGTLLFAPGPHFLEAMSQDLGSVPSGYVNNFAYGTISLAPSAEVTLVDQFTNSGGPPPEAVYVGSLIVPAGGSLNLNGLHLYATWSQIAGVITNGTVSYIPDNGGAVVFSTASLGALSAAGALDEFTFFGHAGQQVTIVVDPGSANVLPPTLNYAEVQLFGPSTNLLSQVSNSVPGVAAVLTNAPLPTDGMYQILVRAPANHAASSGNFLVTLWNSTPQVSPLVLNQQANGQITSPYDLNEWNFAAGAGQQVTFNLLNVSSTGVTFSLHGPNGWSGFTNIMTSSGLVTLPYSGNYTLTAQATGGIYPIAYALNIQTTVQTNLTVGTIYNGTFAGSGQPLLFVINVTNSSPMRILFSVENSASHVELYVKLGAPPTRGVYDYAYQGSISQSGDILIPMAGAGTWYVLVYSDYAVPQTTFSLEAVIQSVFLNGFTPNLSAANADTVLTLFGAGFSNNTVVSLTSTNGTKYLSQNVAATSATQLQAIFLSNSIPAGMYQICASSATASDCGSNFLTMDAVGIPNFQAHIIVPNGLGYHQPSTIYIVYVNTGNAPMPAPLVSFTATQNGLSEAFLTLDSRLAGQAFWTTNEQPGFSHTVQFLASGAVPGVLQPGQTYRIPIYYCGWKQLPAVFGNALFGWDPSRHPITFSLETFTTFDTTPIDWTALGQQIRPPDISDATWATELANLQTQIGSAWGSYVAALNNLVGLVQPISGSAYDATQLFGLLVQQATGYGACTLSGHVLDTTINQLVTNDSVVAQQQLDNGQTIVRTCRTTGAGQFAFTNLPPGTYTLFADGYISVPPLSCILTNQAALSGIILTVNPVPPPILATNPPELINESSPTLALDGNGTPHLVWQRGGEIWHAYYDGTNWIATGPLPGATGQKPVIISGSNIIDGTAPGVMVTWETPQTNGSMLNFAISQTIPGTNAWSPSPPQILNETNEAFALFNEAPALAITPAGNVLGVWQKKQAATTDDTDLYYRSLGLSSSSLIEPMPLFEQPPGAADEPEENCFGVSFDLGEFNVPTWLPVVGGKYAFNVGGQFCGATGCNPSYTLTGTMDAELPILTLNGDVSGNASWETDPEQCDYVFDSAELQFSLEAERNIPLPRLKLGSLPFYLQFSLAAGVSVEGDLGWEGVNFPSWPNSGSVTLELNGSGSAEIRTYVPLIGKVAGTGSIELGLDGTRDSVSGRWCGSTFVQGSFEGQIGPVHGTWELPKQTATLSSCPSSQDISFLDQTAITNVTFTVSPLTGTTNVYAGSPILTNVASNITDDGPPALLGAPSGVVFLAWTLDSETPSNWLGSSVLVAQFQNNVWTPPVEVPNSRGFNSDVKLISDSAGNPLLLWSFGPSADVSLTNTAGELLAAMASNSVVFSLYEGSSWTQPASVATTRGDNHDLTVGRATNGHVVVAWVNSSFGCPSTNIIFSAEWNGLSWSAPAMVAVGTSAAELSCSVIAGRTTIFWTQSTGQDSDPNSTLQIVSSSFDPVSGAWSAAQPFLAGYAYSYTNDGQVAFNMPPLNMDDINGSPPSECCNSTPPSQPDPIVPPCDGCPTIPVQVPGPSDPNAKMGPIGYGPQNYLSGNALFPYNIEFENSTSATAPAQAVNITDLLSTNLDWSTFELSEIGFGNQNFPIPFGSDYFETNVLITINGVAIEVQIEAGIDYGTGEVFANFNSVDPITQLPPEVEVGFLPPEDSTGRGMGYVSYLISPMPNLATGTIITNIAYIQFDENPTIATDEVNDEDLSQGVDTNKMAIVTIDNSPPTSTVTGLPAVENSASFTVCWSGTDIGSGIVAYDVYVATNSGAWSIWLANTTNTCGTFPGQNGQSYAFYSIAYDGAGNAQTNPGVAQASTTVIVVTRPGYTNQHSFASLSYNNALGVFTNSDGFSPRAGLILSSNVLYGTASEGGSADNGAVFKVNTDGTSFVNLHSFTAGSGLFPNIVNTDGAWPVASLILRSNTLYGTAESGGGSGNGTVFRVNTDGSSFTNLYSFSALSGPYFTNSDGASPQAALILAGNTLYGTAEYGGTSGAGTVFGININGTGFTNLHSFTGGGDGAYPLAGLILSGNTLFGTAYQGGNSDAGTVFVINTNGSDFTTLYSFTDGNDGAGPQAGLILLGNTLYGTASQGGSSGAGTVFAVNTNGTGFTNLYSFTDGNDGADPVAALALSGNTLYGTAEEGGSLNYGTVFMVNASGQGFTTLHDFARNSSDGTYPMASLTLSANTLYGTAESGGSSGNGVVFSLSLASSSSPKLMIVLSVTNIILTWPANATGFTLQSTTNLTATAVWSSVSATPMLNNGQYMVTNAISGTQMFYRLSQ